MNNIISFRDDLSVVQTEIRNLYRDTCRNKGKNIFTNILFNFFLKSCHGNINGVNWRKAPEALEEVISRAINSSSKLHEYGTRSFFNHLGYTLSETLDIKKVI